MCFSIPFQVIKVGKNYLMLEGGKKAILEKDMKIKKGEFVRLTGNIVVDKLSAKQGTKLRKTIYQLYT